MKSIISPLIETYQDLLRERGIDFLAESDCDRILSEYAYLTHSRVVSPYKPKTYLTKKRGNHGRTNVHLVFPKTTSDKTGIGSVAFGDTPFEAKINYVCSLIKYGYFDLTSELKVINPLLF